MRATLVCLYVGLTTCMLRFGVSEWKCARKKTKKAYWYHQVSVLPAAISNPTVLMSLVVVLPCVQGRSFCVFSFVVFSFCFAVCCISHFICHMAHQLDLIAVFFLLLRSAVWLI